MLFPFFLCFIHPTTSSQDPWIQQIEETMNYVKNEIILEIKELKLEQESGKEKIEKDFEDWKLKQESDKQKIKKEYQDEKGKQESEKEKIGKDFEDWKLKQESDKEKIKKEYQDEKGKQEFEKEKIGKDFEDWKLKQESEKEKIKKEYQVEKGNIATEFEDWKLEQDSEKEQIKKQYQDEKGKIATEFEDWKLEQESEKENMATSFKEWKLKLASEKENIGKDFEDWKLKQESEKEKKFKDFEDWKLKQESEKEKIKKQVQQLIKELASSLVGLVLSCLVLCLGGLSLVIIFPEPRAMVLKIWNKVMDSQITLKEFTEQMSKQCDVKIEALKEVSMESCQNVMDKIRATEVNWSTHVEDHVDIDNKNSFNDIVENTGQILELSANAKKSILLAGSSKSAKKVVFDFHGLFKEGGTVNIHVGGYAVTRRKTEDNKGELFNLYIAFSRLEMKNIHLLPKNAQNAIENFGAEEGVTDATIKNEERQHLEGDPGVWKAFFQNCGYKELRDHLHVED